MIGWKHSIRANVKTRAVAVWHFEKRRDGRKRYTTSARGGGDSRWKIPICNSRQNWVAIASPRRGVNIPVYISVSRDFLNKSRTGAHPFLKPLEAAAAVAKNTIYTGLSVRVSQESPGLSSTPRRLRVASTLKRYNSQEMPRRGDDEKKKRRRKERKKEGRTLLECASYIFLTIKVHRDPVRTPYASRYREAADATALRGAEIDRNKHACV